MFLQIIQIAVYYNSHNVGEKYLKEPVNVYRKNQMTK